MVGLLQIRNSKLTAMQKARQAILLTKRSEVVWPMAKMLYTEAKRLGWDERSKKSRAGLAVGAATLALVGGQGAGIAALGTAIGLPLWIVLGAGAYFATGVVEDIVSRMPQSKRPHLKDGTYEIIDVEATETKEHGSASRKAPPG